MHLHCSLHAFIASPSAYGLRLSRLSLVRYVPLLFMLKHCSVCVSRRIHVDMLVEGCGTFSVIHMACTRTYLY